MAPQEKSGDHQTHTHTHTQYTCTNSHTAMYKVYEKVQLFFKNTFVARCLRMISRHWKQTAPPPTTLSVLCHGKHIIAALVSGKILNPSLKSRSKRKTNFPSCCRGSSKYSSNGVLLCRSSRLWESTTTWQSVQRCGRMKHASMPLAHTPFILSPSLQKVVRCGGRQKGGETAEKPSK